MQQLAKEIAKQDDLLDMKSDMISEALESLDEGNEEEEEELYNQVLQEAGVHLADEMNFDAPNKESGSNNKVNEQPGTDDLDAMLRELNKK